MNTEAEIKLAMNLVQTAREILEGIIKISGNEEGCALAEDLIDRILLGKIANEKNAAIMLENYVKVISKYPPKELELMMRLYNMYNAEIEVPDTWRGSVAVVKKITDKEWLEANITILGDEDNAGAQAGIGICRDEGEYYDVAMAEYSPKYAEKASEKESVRLYAYGNPKSEDYTKKFVMPIKDYPTD